MSHSVIVGHLTNLMQQHGCRLLFAGESGSRAWGLHSPDSDYDVRCIYAHPANWYLSIEDHRDTIETVFPDDIDISGYELRKALRLFSACNIPINEQLRNPVFYGGDVRFVECLCALIPIYFNKKRALFHYAGIAAQTMPQIQVLSVGLHRVFNIIRPLLACEWIQKNDSMPPTEFQQLLDADVLPLALLNEVTEIVHRKAAALLEDRPTMQLSKDLLYWMTESLSRHQDAIQHLPSGSTSLPLEPLNELFRTCVSVD